MPVSQPAAVERLGKVWVQPQRLIEILKDMVVITVVRVRHASGIICASKTCIEADSLVLVDNGKVVIASMNVCQASVVKDLARLIPVSWPEWMTAEHASMAWSGSAPRTASNCSSRVWPCRTADPLSKAISTNIGRTRMIGEQRAFTLFAVYHRR
jgi:hypothetical protein